MLNKLVRNGLSVTREMFYWHALVLGIATLFGLLEPADYSLVLVAILLAGAGYILFGTLIWLLREYLRGKVKP